MHSVADGAITFASGLLATRWITDGPGTKAVPAEAAASRA